MMYLSPVMSYLELDYCLTYGFCDIIIGQHLKKASLSESSSDIMDLEEGVESTPGLLGERMIVPFSGAHPLSNIDKGQQQLLLQQQQQNCCKPNNSQQQQQQQQLSAGSTNLQQRHNSALAVSIETDV